MEVTVTEVEKKIKYEYTTIVVEGIEKGWYIHYEWGAGPDVLLRNGRLEIVLRRPIQDEQSG